MQTLPYTQAQLRAARQSRDRRFDGLFYVGVLSTGIFCRPICPVRLANEENVSYYTNTAQAISAGYRPCKICKPDSAPASVHPLVDNPLVEQAIHHIQADPGISIQALADGLNITTRHLRAQFQQAMGMSPSHFQRSVQLLFAKRLLQQTALPIVDVAIAAGFQSSRSLQQAFAQQFASTPSSFRRHQKKESTMDAQLFLSYRPPYQWAPMVSFFSKRSIAGIEEVDETSYARYFVLDGEKGKVTAIHQPEKSGFAVTISTANPAHIKPTLNELTRVLDCNADWLVIESSLTAAGFKVTDSTRGLRIPGVWDIFEAGCRAILGQQVSVAAAINKTKQLVELASANQPVWGFPQPSQVTAEVVEQIGMPTTRKHTLIRFAEFMADPTNHQTVRAGQVDELLALKGIGQWTVQYILMRGTSNPDMWMEKDLAILRQCEKYALMPHAAKPWSSYLTLALWHDYMENQ